MISNKLQYTYGKSVKSCLKNLSEFFELLYLITIVDVVIVGELGCPELHHYWNFCI